MSWRAIDVGSGVASYTVQVRDRSSSTWTTWLSNTTATSGSYAGVDGHSYEFRVSAKDRLGNAQPWVSPMGNPGSALAVGGFATVEVSSLNIRSGAGTGFTALAQLPKGERVGVLAGPISSGGYSWYQVQFDFSEWPSADYPRTGWAAAGYGSEKYLIPAVAPTVTTLAPFVSLYGASPLWFSPNGDGVMDVAYATYTLAGTASVRLDVLATNGSIVDSTSFGTQAAGYHRQSWDGQSLRRGSGARRRVPPPHLRHGRKRVSRRAGGDRQQPGAREVGSPPRLTAAPSATAVSPTGSRGRPVCQRRRRTSASQSPASRLPASPSPTRAPGAALMRS